MQIKGLLLDFDGLILDTESVEVEAWQMIFSEHNLEYPDWIWQHLIGRSELEANKIPGMHLATQLGLEGTAAEQFEAEARVRRRKLTHKLLESRPLMPGVLDVLNQAEKLSRPVAIVSSSNREWVEGHLGRFNLVQRFKTIVCGHEGLPSKPAPDLYLEALKRLNLKPAEALAIEDSPRGIEAAQAAGLYTICVPNKLTCQLDTSKANKQLISLRELDLAAFSK